MIMFANIMMVLCGIISIYLTNLPEAHQYKKYAPIVGLLGQPFWFYICWITQQWGILALTVVYTYCWTKGLLNYWFPHK
jgi:hypothetical protein